MALDLIARGKPYKHLIEAPFILKWIEPLVFALFLIHHVSVIWSLEVYSTLDGPAHLHNANLLNHIRDNAYLQSYFVEAPVYLPNYFTDVVLSKLMQIAQPFTAEKIFLSAIVIALPLSFRSLVKAIQSEGTVYTYLVFLLLPFSKLFNVGFFNFISGFIFFNFAIVLFLRLSRKGLSFRLWLLSFLNAIALYYAHAMVFALAGLVILVFLGAQGFKSSTQFLKLTKQLLLIYGVPLVLFVFFLVNVEIQNYKGDMKPFQKVLGLTTFDAGVIYTMENEITNSVLATVLLLFLLGSTITLRILNSSLKGAVQPTDIFLLLSLGSVYLVFHSTDGMFGGMFMQRLYFIAYYFGILWILCHLDFFKLHYVTGLIMTITLYLSLVAERNKTLQAISPLASELTQAGKLLRDNSLVHVLPLHDFWLQSHFSNYLATEKPIVITENYEASLAWFPLMWSDQAKSQMRTPLDGELSRFNYPDYVLLMGRWFRLKEEKYAGMRNFIEQRTTPIYCPKDSGFLLYKVTRAFGE